VKCDIIVFVLQSEMSGMTKGFGFVEFATKDGYNKAVSQDHHMLENNKVQSNSPHRH
jgi:hypothetical protein